MSQVASLHVYGRESAGFSEMVEALKMCELFSSLPHDDVVGLVASLGGSEMHFYETGDTVVAHGHHITRIYVIAEGEVKRGAPCAPASRALPFPEAADIADVLAVCQPRLINSTLNESLTFVR